MGQHEWLWNATHAEPDSRNSYLSEQENNRQPIQNT
jgi:hypothetical protein